MLSWFKALDLILRGEATKIGALRRGTIEIPTLGLSIVLVILSMCYGVCMGCFGLFKEGGASFPQLLASIVKVPALFLLTLLVTFPSLYVFNALVGSRLNLKAVLRLLIAALAVTITVLASLGPIVAFFSVSTTSYPFMKLLNVMVFALSGFLGMAFLLQTLHRLSLSPTTGPVEDASPVVISPEAIGESPANAPGALDSVERELFSKHVKTVFWCWIVLFALVGSQMAWVLRPFIGAPDQPFTLFRARDSHFFQAVWQTIVSLMS